MHHLVEAVTNLLDHYGLWAVFVLMILESACIPAPSEVIMLYAGYLVAAGDASFTAAVAAGVVGNVIGSQIAWVVGAYAGRDWLEHPHKRIPVNRHHLELADRWFARHGTSTVLVTRMLPIVRTFISLPAGIARMPLARFTVYTFIGCVPWVAMLTYIGVKLGPHWERAHEALRLGDYVVAAAVIIVGGWLLLRARRRARSNTRGQLG